MIFLWDYCSVNIDLVVKLSILLTFWHEYLGGFYSSLLALMDLNLLKV